MTNGMIESPRGTRRSRARQPTRTLLVLAVAGLMFAGCESIRQGSLDLPYRGGMVNARLGPERVERTDYDPFGWAGRPDGTTDPSGDEPDSVLVDKGDDANAAAARAAKTDRDRNQVADRAHERAAPRAADASKTARAPSHSDAGSDDSASATPIETPTTETPQTSATADARSTSDTRPDELADAPSADDYDTGRAAQFVVSVYGLNDVDLSRAARSEGRPPTVVELYRHAYKHGVVYQADRPAVGDLVFFHNTHDRNGDGRLNDWYTLVGVVESISAGDSTVTALAYIDGGVVRVRLDPKRKTLAKDATGDVVNTPLRSEGLPSERAGLAGALFAGYGNLLGDASRVVVIDNWQPGMLTAKR